MDGRFGTHRLSRHPGSRPRRHADRWRGRSRLPRSPRLRPAAAHV
jgi:hypothetical protein